MQLQGAWDTDMKMMEVTLNKKQMNILPTAEEVYNDFHFNYKGDENYILEAMRKFTKLHVKAALEAASKIKTYGLLSVPLFNEEQVKLILNVYPENLIK